MRSFAIAAGTIVCCALPASAQPTPGQFDILEPISAPGAATWAQNGLRETNPVLPAAVLSAQEAPPSLPLMYVGALVGSAAGLVLGGYTGYHVESAMSAGRCGDSCGILGIFSGAWLGSSIGAATGAHLANGSRGNAALGTVVTAGVTAAAVGVGMWISGAESSNPAGVLALVAVPALQLHTAVRVELATARRR